MNQAARTILEFSGPLYRFATELGMDSGGFLLDDFAALFTRRVASSEVVLGKWDGGAATSYVRLALDRGASYFSMEDLWSDMAAAFGKDNLWRSNQAFLRQQIEAGKTILLSHNPAGASGFFSLEVEYLRGLGFKFIKEGNLWKAVR